MPASHCRLHSGPPSKPAQRLQRMAWHAVCEVMNDRIPTQAPEAPMSLSLILLIVLVLLLLGAVPAWPHSRSWGYGPSGLLGVVLLVVIILVLTGRL